MREAFRFGRGAVATPHYLASAAGQAVLVDGGNAVDAAVGANLALGVVAPYLCGYGGDLFALVWDGEMHGYRSAGRSGASATIATVGRDGAETMPMFGPHSVTVPGAVCGWFELLERFGTRSFRDLAETALVFARDGFPLTARGAFTFERMRAEHRSAPWSDELLATYSAPATTAGEPLVQPGLADTIELLGRDGPSAFYRGPIGQAVVETVEAHGGALRADDLAVHEGAWVTPISAPFADVDVVELPPPTQGVTALEALQIVDGAEMPADAVSRQHLLVEAAKLALVDRDRWVSDPDTMSVSAAEIYADAHIAEQRAHIDPQRAAYPSGVPAADGGTAYLCAADAEGMAISLIQSNFAAIGSGVHVRRWGINLQNRGASFSLDPSHVNALAPAKLPMHTLIPAMVCRDGTPELVFGTMGGHGQAQTHLQVLFRHYVEHDEIQSAIAAPRWLLDPGDWRLAAEKRFGPEWASAMAERGHHLEVVGSFDTRMGHAHAIGLDSSGLLVATDPRAEGAALGW